MANNLMYLVNKRTGTRIIIAKFYPSTGWYTAEAIKKTLDAAFDESDFGHLTDQERREKEYQVGFGPPYAFDPIGDEWTLEYSDVTEGR